MALTDPLDVAVTDVAQKADVAIPDAPLCLPCCRRTASPNRSDRCPCFVKAGFPACSEWTHNQSSGIKMRVMAAHSAQPCRVSPIIFPNV